VKKLLFLLFFAANSYAWNPTPQAIEEQAPKTAFSQISVFQNAARPEYNAYLNAGIIYLPSPSQSALLTEWGTHDGFAFRQRLGMWLTDNFNGKEKQGLTYGFGWFGERQGWSNEDFLLYPYRGDFSQINQVHSWGITIANPSKHFLFGSGLQYLNAMDETFRWWLIGTYSRFSVVPVFYKSDLQLLNAKIDLQTRELRGHENSWQNYLPDLELSLFSKDSLRMFISQNIFKQKFYLEGAFWANPADFAYAAFKYYPDPSRFLLALEATATKKENGNVYFGSGITVPFLRVAYNHADYYENFFKNNGTWIVELCLNIGTSGDSFFALAAPKAAPSQISRSPLKKRSN
jgi:hypothetical protein